MPRPKGFSIRKKRHEQRETVAVEPHSATELAEERSATQLVAEPVSALSDRWTKQQLAEMLWSTDYVPYFMHELEQYADVAVRMPSNTCLQTHPRLTPHVVRVRVSLHLSRINACSLAGADRHARF